MQTDRYGSQVSIEAEVLPLWDDAMATYHRLDDGADELIADVLRLDPDFCLAHAVTSFLAREGGDLETARTELEEARRCLPRATDRERSFVSALEVHVDDGLWGAEQSWRRHHADFPGDVLALEPLSYYAYFAARPGGSEEFAAITARVRAAVGDNIVVRDLRSWTAQEQRRTDDAHDLADSVLAEDPRWISAAHAKAHAFYESREHDAGLRWIDSWYAALPDPPAYSRHLSWHAGLHELALGDTDAVLRRLVADSADPATRRLGDAAMTVWRCQLLGLWPEGQDPSGFLAETARARADDVGFTMGGWVTALGLASVQDVDGLRSLAATTATSAVPGVAELITPLASALAAWLDGDAARCAEIIAPLGPELDRCGGSEAQLDVLRDTYVAALAAGGRTRAAYAYAAARDALRPWPVDRRLARPELASLGTTRRGAPTT